ncbi:MAG: uroporphyrin-III C-methyltransferase [Rhodomicrobium sp.]|nr:MAG: uroporphyrin-III C-methyltransferase [Rhodomicrobium sp.]
MTVTLIGAGPGDPDLLTLKAVKCLTSADVIIYDRLVNKEILSHAPQSAKLIYVGKQAGQPSPSQEEINCILVREALTGKEIVRLKGGDPNIFGRAQEEIAACQLVDVDVDVIPGISAAQAASASIRLPLTYRGKNRSITFITAATRDQIIASELATFTLEQRPFAIYMGLRLVDHIVKALADAGADMTLDVVIVENASLADERVITGRLEELALLVKTQNITGPSVVFVGLSYEEMGLKADPRCEGLENGTVVSLSLMAG